MLFFALNTDTDTPETIARRVHDGRVQILARIVLWKKRRAASTLNYGVARILNHVLDERNGNKLNNGFPTPCNARPHNVRQGKGLEPCTAMHKTVAKPPENVFRRGAPEKGTIDVHFDLISCQFTT